jgi:hypothetical protein
MEIDTEIREIKDLLMLLNQKIDVLIDEREVSSLMKHACMQRQKFTVFS